ncbi:MAG: DUF305 domain-containing protein [Pseudomonadota bacterium]
MMRRLGVYISPLLLVACTGQGETDNALDAVEHSEHTSQAVDGELSEAQRAYAAVNARMHAAMAEVSEDPDIAFMQGMLAHHRGAVEMSEVALEYGKDEQVRDLAQRIIDAQQEEIDEMEAWLAAREGK